MNVHFITIPREVKSVLFLSTLKYHAVLLDVFCLRRVTCSLILNYNNDEIMFYFFHTPAFFVFQN